MTLGGFQPGKLHQLWNFIDIAGVVGRSTDTQRDNYAKKDYYCYVGRLSMEKGVKTLIEAAKQLPFPLKIVGTGPLWDELRQPSGNHKALLQITFFEMNRPDFFHFVSFWRCIFVDRRL